MVDLIIADERKPMSDEKISSPEINGHLRSLVLEIHRLRPYDAVMLTSAIMRVLAEHLLDLGVEVELSTKTPEE